jgi:hypothetical protein
MADDKMKKDQRDRSRVVADEDYELAYFAKENGITVEQAVTPVERFGNDCETLEREARKLA